MSVTKKNESGETGDSKNILDELSFDLHSSPTNQIALGASAGFCTGLIVMKIGKFCALGLGGGIMLLGLASAKEYININWDRVNESFDKVTDAVRGKATDRTYSWVKKLTLFSLSHTLMSSSFIGAFLIGLAFY